jgi:hypothetical protein
MNKTRNLQSSPKRIESLVDCERLAKSLFPNPQAQKKGSCASSRWSDNTSLICRAVKGEAVEDIEMISADLVDMGILFPVCAIHH